MTAQLSAPAHRVPVARLWAARRWWLPLLLAIVPILLFADRAAGADELPAVAGAAPVVEVTGAGDETNGGVDVVVAAGPPVLAPPVPVLTPPIPVVTADVTADAAPPTAVVSVVVAADPASLVPGGVAVTLDIAIAPTPGVTISTGVATDTLDVGAAVNVAPTDPPVIRGLGVYVDRGEPDGLAGTTTASPADLVAQLPAPAPVGASPIATTGWNDPADARPSGPPGSNANRTVDPSAHGPPGIGAALDRLSQALAAAARSTATFMSSSGIGLAALAAMLATLALVPPRAGWLLPASVDLRPMRFVSPPDVPG